MAINKALEAAMRALSNSQGDIRKSYHLQRMANSLTSFEIIKPLAKTYDTKIKSGDYDVPVRIFFPKDETDINDLIIFFHGGGWVTGNIDTYNHVCAAIAKKTGCKVASVDYRLAPEHRFPIGVTDCYEVTKHFMDNSEELFHISKDKVTLMGDSAGGNLAAVVSLMLRDKGEFVPKQQILIYPATYNDHTENSPYTSVKTNGKDYVLTSERIEEYMDLYRSSDDDLKNPYFAPLLAEDFGNQPKTLIVTAEFDPLRDEGEDYGQKLREAGGDVQVYRMMNAVHGFLSLPSAIPQVRRCHDVIREFLSESKVENLEEANVKKPEELSGKSESEEAPSES